MKKAPTGMQLTPFDEAYQADPYPVIHELRELDPFHHDQELQRYFVCNYEDVKAILRDSQMLTDPRSSKPASFARHFISDQDAEPGMLLADEPRRSAD